MKKQQNPYGNDHPYTSVKGSFYSLLSQLPNEVTSDVKYNGRTFAIAGRFKYLNFAKGIMSHRADQVHHEVSRDWTLPRKGSVILFLASTFFLNLCGLSVAEAIAGGLHEGGHALCDLGGSNIASREEFDKYIKPHIIHPPSFYAKMDLAKWVNVIADGRLERGVGMVMPATKFYFFSIQRWVHRLEEKVRGESLASDFMMALRDSAKGWVDDYSQEVYAEYQEEARDLVEKVRPLWEKAIPTDANWEETAHLPLSVALEICNALYEEAQDLTQPSPEMPNLPTDEDDDVENDEDVANDESLVNENSEGGLPYDPYSGSEEEAGASSSEEEGEDEEEEEGASSSGGGGEEEGEEEEGASSGEEEDEEEGGKDEEKEASSGGFGNKGCLKMLEDLLNGEGIALNPSSAMDKNIQDTEASLDHRIYIPNGQKIIYSKDILSRRLRRK